MTAPELSYWPSNFILVDSVFPSHDIDVYLKKKKQSLILSLYLTFEVDPQDFKHLDDTSCLNILPGLFT